MRLTAVHNGDAVLTIGRLFVNDEGEYFIRPRRTPYDETLSEEQQRDHDSTSSKVRVFSADLLPDRSSRIGQWVKLVSTFHDGSLDALSATPVTGPFVDSWSVHPSMRRSDVDPLSVGWYLTKERKSHLQSLTTVVLAHSKEWTMVSFGLSGTSAGGLTVSLSVQWVTDGLAAWAADVSEDDLSVHSFINPV
ncbi:hypothetical protein [Psychromicrobium xiongbiense]|uniref:hypothetical protein n=1 Tax=Psychromicrobium xiongbiense TaxID=3051184 RepID=UPI0025566F26|nr:hypothetical protein [Psychromicrobium sp. YIM S02556]